MRLTSDNLRDHGLQYLIDNCDLVTICTAPETVYANAVANALASQVVDSDDFSLGDVTGGRGVTLAQQVIAEAATSGFGTHLHFLNTDAEELVALVEVHQAYPAPGDAAYQTAQAGAASTITLDENAHASDDEYNGLVVVKWDVDGNGQATNVETKAITDYVGSTKVATISGTWTANPTSSTRFAVYGRHITSGEPVTIEATTVSIGDAELVG